MPDDLLNGVLAAPAHWHPSTGGPRVHSMRVPRGPHCTLVSFHVGPVGTCSNLSVFQSKHCIYHICQDVLHLLGFLNGLRWFSGLGWFKTHQG